MLREKLLKLNRRTKKIAVIIVDYCSIIISFYFASYILFQDIKIENIGYFIVIYLPPLIAIFFYFYSNLYQNILRFMNTGTFFTLFSGAFVYSIILMLAPLILLENGAFAFSLITVNFFTLMFFLTSTRLIARWLLVTSTKSQINVIIYGAGKAGVQISNAILALDDYNLVAFIDDDSDLVDARISDIRVYPFKRINSVIDKYDAKQILVAIPSLNGQARTQLFSKLETLPISIRTLPNISEIV
jgi:FlaA1/EpsC-like NDP-sugar epimerase